MVGGGAAPPHPARHPRAARGSTVVRREDQTGFPEPDADAEPAPDEAQEKFSFAFRHSEPVAQRKNQVETSFAHAIAESE